MVQIAWIIAVVSLFFGLFLKRKGMPIELEVCKSCGYSLDGLKEGAVCPECGQSDPGLSSIRRTEVSWKPTPMVGSTLILAAATTHAILLPAIWESLNSAVSNRRRVLDYDRLDGDLWNGVSVASAAVVIAYALLLPILWRRWVVAARLSAIGCFIGGVVGCIAAWFDTSGWHAHAWNWTFWSVLIGSLGPTTLALVWIQVRDQRLRRRRGPPGVSSPHANPPDQ